MEFRNSVLIKVKDDDLVNGTVPIPDTVNKIQYGCFAGCKNLTSITIPGSVTSIGHEAFCFCRNLSSISLNEGLAHIDDSAFRNCSMLTDITFPHTLKSIGKEAFFGCRFSSITLPDTLENIMQSAFPINELRSVTLKGTSHPVKISSGGFLIIEKQQIQRGRETWYGNLYQYKKYGKWHLEQGWVVQTNDRGSLFNTSLEGAFQDVAEFERQKAAGYFIR